MENHSDLCADECDRGCRQLDLHTIFLWHKLRFHGLDVSVSAVGWLPFFLVVGGFDSRRISIGVLQDFL